MTTFERAEGDGPDYHNMDTKYFPFDEMRPFQKEIYPKIEEVMNSDKKVVFCEFATGVGKSPLAIMLAKASGDAYLMTADKNLQAQYMRDFHKDVDELKGRSNYACRKHNREDGNPFNCSDSPCQSTPQGSKKCTEEFSCQYHDALFAASRSEVAMFNFAAAYNQLKYNRLRATKDGGTSGWFGKRELMIIDEGHLIVDYLTGAAAIEINRDTFYKHFAWQDSWQYSVNADGMPDWWIENIEDHADINGWLDFFGRVGNQCNRMLERGLYNEKSKKYIESLMSKIGNFFDGLEHLTEKFGKDFSYDDFFAIEIDSRSVQFRPVDISGLFKFLQTRAKKIVIMSATFLNVPLFAQQLGVDMNDVEHLYLASPFPRENRKLYINYKIGRLGRKDYDANKQKMFDFINRAMDRYQEKGIIHISSYRLADDIYNNLSHANKKRILYPKDAASRSEALEHHAKTDRPTVLMSPSMKEGVDLKGDLSRFQIIAKVPYPNFGDPLVLKRNKMYPGYSNLLTLLSLIQSVGRSVRSSDDYCDTFLLDSCIDMVLNRSGHMIPEDFTKTLRRSPK